MSAQGSDSLTIKEYPIMFWLMGVIFSTVGVGLTSAGLLSDDSPLLMGVIFLGIGLLLGVAIANITTIQADRVTGTLNIYSWSLLRRSAREIPISDLAAVDIETSHSHDGNTYRIIFRKRSGECVPLHSYYSSRYREKEKKALRISEFLGIPGPGSQPSPLQAIGSALRQPFEQKQEGESSGVRWTIETSVYGALPVTRWSSPDFKFEGSFLLLMQIPQSAINLSGPKWLGGISAFLYRQVLRLFGFSEEDTPGLDEAKPYDLPKPGLGEYFVALTNDSYGTQQLITPWTGNLLLDWVRRFPIQKRQSNDMGIPGQLAVLYSPLKLYVVSFQSSNNELIDEMIRLGIGLVKELGTV